MHRFRHTEPYQIARRFVALVYGTLGVSPGSVSPAGASPVPSTGPALERDVSPGSRLRQQSLRVAAEIDALSRSAEAPLPPDALRRMLDELPELIEECASREDLSEATCEALHDLRRQLVAALTSLERSAN